jgi:hypothetical protein
MKHHRRLLRIAIMLTDLLSIGMLWAISIIFLAIAIWKEVTK